METKNQNPNKEIKFIEPNKVKKNDKIFCVRSGRIFYIGKIRK